MKSQATTTQEPATQSNLCCNGDQGNAGRGACTCGPPICFERPNYFCGQLLSDADLSSEQSYVREKLKLYHRTLNGHGIVCGLRITCDPECCGSIRIGDGYAIDNCGNDLIVCEPAHFDVIAALRAKNWLIAEDPCDPCEKEHQPRCKVKQCFYVTICYAEEQSDFTTPFKTNCGPGAAVCEPTRTKETVTFDILRCPPKPRNYLDEIEERIACCWKVFTDGPLGKRLQEFFHEHSEIFEGKGREDRDYCQIFCQLKVLFQHHLKRCPSLYDCTFWEQVCRLECPEQRRGDYEVYQEAFCKLFALIRRYAFECILGEMIFRCPSPCEAVCVGLGTVEVEDDKLLRVCNCPRKYVWTLANFSEVFLATFVGGAACAPHERAKIAEPHGQQQEEIEIPPSRKERKNRGECGCCASFDFDCRQFIDLFRSRPNFGTLAASAPIHAIRELIESLKAGFDFTDPLAFSPEIFKNMTVQEAESLAQKLGGERALRIIRQPEHYQAMDPVTAILNQLLKKPGDPMVAYSRDNKIVEVIPEPSPGEIIPPIDYQTKTQNLEAQLTTMQGEITRLREEITALARRLSARRPPSTRQGEQA